MKVLYDEDLASHIGPEPCDDGTKTWLNKARGSRPWCEGSPASAGACFAYHTVPTNSRALLAFRHHVVDLWRRTLRRRSQSDRTTWRHVDKPADRWLPKPRITHPWPSQRFRVKHPRWEPYAGIPPVRFCAGGVQR